MARLIPKIEIGEIELKPERDVARALVEQLPEECIVYHSYPWLRADRHARAESDTLREGEADFVIVDPGAGILILEVKGGEVHYDQGSHLWFRNVRGSQRPIKDPFEQARRNMHTLMTQIRRHSFPREDHPPCGFGYAVVFPDCNYAGPVPPGADNAIILSADDLPYLGRRVGDILRKWNRSDSNRAMTKRELDGVVKGLSPSFRLLPVLFRQIEEQEEKLFRLTEEQLRLLDFLKSRSRAAINGVAGSGKTLLARAQAERFADSGLKTLLLCYNKSLAEWLQSSLAEEYRDQITIRHFHGLCSDFCREAGIDLFDEKPTEKFWKSTAPQRLMDALDVVPDRFDAVVVDEGQDFYPDWWLPIELINKQGEEGPLYVFYDPAQNLFLGGSVWTPHLGKPFELPTNCRNTREIASLCSDIQGVDIPVHKNAPEGVRSEIAVAKTEAEQLRACKELLSNWTGGGKLECSQIVILGPHAKKKSPLAETSSLGDIKITPTLSRWEKGDAVLYSSIRAFKGLEADAVILIDIPKPDSIPHFGEADFYVACSRAKHLLAVVARDEEVKDLVAKD